MDNEIRIRWSGGERTFAPGQTVVIGRDVGTDVELTNATVSRRHAELAVEAGRWVLRDLGSTQGTYVAGQRKDRLEVSGTVEVVLGDPRTGEHLTLVVAANESTSMNDQTSGSGDAGSTGAPAPGTVLVGGGLERPGGRLQEQQLGGATVVTGQTLNVECGGRTYSFEPGSTVVIGRDESCDVIVANPTVSRRHATIQHDGKGWSITDAGSSSGTFIDERKVSTAALSGSTAVYLGSPDTGERMVVVTSGATRRTSTKRRRNAVALGAGVLAAVALLLALGAVFLASRGGPDDDQLARATVLIEVDGGSGSGSIVDAEEGLILTNAHVADPKAPGQALLYGMPASAVDEAGELRILVAPGLDKAAEFKYIAEVVASDGYLDLAVLRITKTAAGALIEDGDLDGLTEVELGQSADVTSGSNVSVFGFPGIAKSKAVSVTRGVIQGGVQDDRLGDNRAFFNTDAVINPGNSGGLAADDQGKIIGVPTLGNLSKLDATGRPIETIVSSIRPIDYAKPLIEEARTGKSAKSPSDLRPLTDEVIDESTVDVGVLGSKAGVDFDECTVGEAVEGDEALAVVFDFEGFVADENQDLAVVVQSLDDDVIGYWTSTYPLRWPESGCGTVSLPLADELVGSSVFVTIYLGPSYEEAAYVRLPVSAG